MSSTRGMGRGRAIAIIVLVAVAALGGYGYYSTTRPGTTVAVTSSTTAPHNLVVDEAQEPQSIDPAFDYEAPGWEIMLNVYEPLVFYKNATNLTQIEPLLANSWDSSPDGLTYTFNLRHDVKFSDGTPLTAYAVWFSIYRSILMNQAPSWILSQNLDAGNVTAQMLNTMNFVNPNATEQAIMGSVSDSVQVLDEYTVRFHLAQAYAYFLVTIADPIAAPVNPVAVQAHGGVTSGQTNAWVTYASAGAGPYLVSEWKKGDHITLTRNTHYWGPAPFLDIVVIYYKADILTRILDLRTGAAQMAVIDQNHLSDISNDTNIVVKNFGPSVIIDFVFMNTQQYPFDKVEVRQAVVHGIDFDSIIKSGYADLAEPFVGPLAAGMPHYNSNFKPYEYNPGLSIQLLVNAGFKLTLANGTIVNPTGTPFPAVKFYYQSASAAWTRAAQIAQSNLADIGIHVELTGVSNPTFLSLLQLDPKNPSYPPIGINEWLPDYISPDDYGYPLVNSDNHGIAGDYSNYNDTYVNDHTVKAKFTLDPTERQKLWDDVTQKVYEDAPYGWIAQLDGYLTYRSNVSGTVWNPIFAFVGGGTLYKYVTLTG